MLKGSAKKSEKHLAIAFRRYNPKTNKVLNANRL